MSFAVPEQATQSHQNSACGKGDDRGFQRFGVSVGQPVKTGDTDEDPEAFADREMVAQSHQRGLQMRTVASAGCWAGSIPWKYCRVASMNCLMFDSNIFCSS